MINFLLSLPFLLGATESPIDVNSLPGSQPGQSLTGSSELGHVLSIVFNILGALALLMVTVSGFRYMVSAGDPKKAAQAKNGIIYALVGLVIAITARAIVAFVVNRAVPS